MYIKSRKGGNIFIKSNLKIERFLDEKLGI